MYSKTLARLACAVVAVTAMSGLAASVASAASNLQGAGSTLVAPIVAEWGVAWANQTGSSAPIYSAVGSGAGLKAIGGNQVDFGGSDAPLSASTTACGGCYEIPWALSATGVTFNIPGVHRLHLTGPVLAAIYLGQITHWNDRRITSLNKGTHLPSTQITPIHRSDGSGDSYAFTDYLSSVSGQFRGRVGRAVLPTFPSGPGARGNSGMVSLTSQTNGGIAYVAVSYLISNRKPAVAIKNAAGNYEYPNLSNIANAASVVGHPGVSPEIHIVNPSRRARSAYPISTFTYAIVKQSDPLGNGGALKSFIQFAIGPGQAFGPALDFVPLPARIKAADQATLNQIS